MPIIIISILFFSAIVALISKNTRIAKIVAMISLGITAALSVVMTADVISSGPIYITAGAEPFNISLKVGMIECFMACLFTVVGFLIIWASMSMIAHDVEEKKIPLFYFLMLGLLATLCAVVFFDSIFNVFIFIELSSFAAAGIVIVKNQQENLKAGLKYLSLSILGSGLVMMGIVMLYSLTGVLSMDGIHQALAAEGFFVANISTIAWAYGLITIGVSFKSALFPCHIWLPDAHGTAPSPSSAILSSLVLKAYIIFYIKMFYRVLGFEMANTGALRSILNAVLVVGVVAMLAGSVLAILQTDIKRMIAYSSVAQVGYIFMGIGLGTPLGVFAAVFHILAHAVTKSGLFLIAGSIIEQTHNRRLDKMGGLGMQMPLTMALFTVGALSMIGIPLFVGFNSKWNFAVAIMDSKALWVLIALSISALLNALYYLPVVIRAFFGEEAKENAEHFANKERPVRDMLPIIILSGLVVVFGVASGPISAMIQAGLQSL